jgi:proteinaceous RNase P
VQLRAVHLTKKNRADLLAGIGKLSRERESADHFDGFVTWLKRRGPLPFLVDGANVGMYNQNFSGSGFNFHQVEKVMHRLRSSSRAARAERVAAMKVDGAFEGKTGEASEGKKEEQPEGKKEESAEKKELQPEEKNTETEGNTTETEEKKAETPTETAETTAGTKNTNPSSAKPKTEPVSDASVLDSAEKSHGANCPVVFLHVRRVRGGPANSQKARDTLDTWKRNGELFTTPAGSNDDWYVLTFPNHDTVSSPCLRNRLFAHTGYLYTQD